MATTYTHDNFTPSAVPTVFKKDVAALIATAVELGWTFMVKSDNNATLIAPEPNEHQDIHLSSRRNSGPLRRLHNKIVKYGKQPVAVAAPKVKAEQPVEQAPVVDWDAAAELNQTEAAVDALVEDAFREIINVTPMVSTGHNGLMYESDVAKQRQWSDGSVDYVCAQCDYVGASPRSMASHWKKHTAVDPSLRSVAKLGGVPQKKYPKKPRKKATASVPDGLAELTANIQDVLEHGIDWTDMHAAAEQLATAALKTVPERPTVTVTVGNPPTTDAEILDAIRALVDGGQSERLAEMEQRISVLESELDQAKAEAAAAKSTLSTFRDLINESV